MILGPNDPRARKRSDGIRFSLKDLNDDNSEFMKDFVKGVSDKLDRLEAANAKRVAEGKPPIKPRIPRHPCG